MKRETRNQLLTITAIVLSLMAAEAIVPWVSGLDWLNIAKWVIGLTMVCVGVPAWVYVTGQQSQLGQPK